MGDIKYIPSFIHSFPCTLYNSIIVLCAAVRTVGGGDQAYSRLSTTHGDITDCKLDSVVYAGVCV